MEDDPEVGQAVTGRDRHSSPSSFGARVGSLHNFFASASDRIAGSQGILLILCSTDQFAMRIALKQKAANRQTTDH